MKEEFIKVFSIIKNELERQWLFEEKVDGTWYLYLTEEDEDCVGIKKIFIHWIKTEEEKRMFEEVLIYD